MPKSSHALLITIALAGLSFSVSAQTTGPQLTVSPGLIYTVASRATDQLSFSHFNSVAFKAPGTLYVSDAHSETNSQGTLISLANLYAIDLSSGQVTRVAGIAPDHNNGNIADCAAVGTPAQASCPGDGGLAVNAQFHEPAGLVFDASGNLFIADSGQNVIRRVDAATGIITTIAGTGARAVGCDACVATQSNLAFPTGVALDGANNLYVADTLNNRVRKIASPSFNPIITTIAGTTAPGFGGDNGPATSAQLNQPLGVAVDSSGNVFIAERINNVIREVTAGNIYTVAGQGGTPGYTGDGGPATSATLRSPRSVAVDAGGNLYIADTDNNVIRKVTGDANRIISTIGGNTTAGYSGDGGAAFSAALNGPLSLVIEGQNNLYFVDNQFAAVRKITSAPAPLTLTSGASPLKVVVANTGGQLLNVSFAFSNSNFFVAETGGCYQGIPLNPGNTCTIPVSFNPSGGGTGTSGTLNITSSAGSQPGPTASVSLFESSGLYFVPISPCRAIETRLTNSGSSAPNNFVGPAFAKGEIRSFILSNSNVPGGCAPGFISSQANVQAYSLNVTVVPKGALGYVTVYPGGPGVSLPNTSTLNSYDGRIKANAAIVPAGSDRTVNIYADAPTDIVVDINGYYVSQNSPAASNNGQTPLAFYPLPPCRAVDTRLNSGLPTSGHPLLGGTEAPYVLAGSCNLPAGAQAYALNYTVLPKNGTLFYLTTWPTGTTRPNGSTLNAPTGTVTANAAIVPANANGSVSVYSTDDTDLIIDVAGYYASPSANGLALYNIATPCRAYDTRVTANDPHATINGVNSFPVSAPCGVSAAAQSYVLNTTVIPPANQRMRYLSAWPQGTGLPTQSVLNAYDGQVTSNLAAVPTVNGLISVYLSEPAGLILDLYAYFAP